MALITAVQAIGLIAFGDENAVKKHLLEYLGTANKEKYGNVIYKSYMFHLLELIEQNRPFPDNKFVPAPDIALTKEDVEKIIEYSGLSFVDFKQDLLAQHAKEENIKKIINNAKQIFLNAILSEQLKIFGELRKINIETGKQKIKDHDSNEIPLKFLRRDNVALGLHDNGYRVLANVDNAFLYGMSPSEFNRIIAQHIDHQKEERIYWGNLKVNKVDIEKLFLDKNLSNSFINYSELSFEDNRLFNGANLYSYLKPADKYFFPNHQEKDGYSLYNQDELNYINLYIKYMLELIGKHNNNRFGSTAIEQHNFFCKRTAEQEAFFKHLFISVQTEKKIILDNEVNNSYLFNPHKLHSLSDRNMVFCTILGNTVTEQSLYAAGIFYMINFLFNAVKKNDAAYTLKLVSDLRNFTDNKFLSNYKETDASDVSGNIVPVIIQEKSIPNYNEKKNTKILLPVKSIEEKPRGKRGVKTISQDDSLVDEMYKKIKNKEVNSINAAAESVVKSASGNGTELNKVRRLSRKFTDKFGSDLDNI